MTRDPGDWSVIGVDPAPTKETVIYDGEAFKSFKPHEMRRVIADAIAKNPRLIIAWDAPLSFDHLGSVGCLPDFYDRKIDKVVRKWAAEAKGFSAKAINARAFAGLPHWAISCATLGLPFGTPPSGLRLVEALAGSDGPVAIEVHPAVALGVWWLEKGVEAPFPNYKGDKQQTREIARALRSELAELTEERMSDLDDDHLDALAAYRLGVLFRDGKACWVGSPKTGGYVLPMGRACDELSRRVTA